MYVYTWLHHSVGSLPLAKNALHSPTSNVYAFTSTHMVLGLCVCQTVGPNLSWPDIHLKQITITAAFSYKVKSILFACH